jgi:signal transduction histidine kinase
MRTSTLVDAPPSRLSQFFRSMFFKRMIIFVTIFILAEILIFGFLYWSTVAVYERRLEEEIERDVAALEGTFSGLSTTEMAAIVSRRSTDNPGEIDSYILTNRKYEYVAGNIRVWPSNAPDDSPIVKLVLGADGAGERQVHKARTLTFQDGYHLLVGRNVTELEEMQVLIRKGLVRSIFLTLVIGFVGGYISSRVAQRRFDRINKSTFAILEGDIGRRIPVRGTGDELDVLSCNLNDMLDRIELLMRGMREVTDNVAHDLRKPITRLKSRIEVTLMGSPDTGAYREALERTLAEADDILAMFNAILTIAEAESGALRDRFEQVDLARVARSVTEVYEPLAEESGLEIDLRADHAVAVSGDPHLISQALANLIDNAIKYAPRSGPLAVRAFRAGSEAGLSVADRGPGIPERRREEALERFGRLEESRTTPGSGLGLSLVRAVADLHGGTVTLDDARPGLAVTITFPAARSAGRDSKSL